MGVDFVTPLDLERLPDCAIAELALVFEACEQCLCWPAQLLLILGRMLPKKSSPLGIGSSDWPPSSVASGPLSGSLW
eukprot:9490520-Pyramimonas_sp.AAC.1